MVSYRQFEEYQNQQTVVPKLRCISGIRALRSHRFCQSLKSQTEYMCESSIYLCEDYMLLHPPLHYW